MKRHQPNLILFAKAPVAGKVKTRLHSHLSQAQSAEVAQLLLEQSLKLATESWQGRVILSVAPADHQGIHHPFIDKMKDQFSIEVCQQSEGSLGERMYNALLDSAPTPAAILGCDVPHLGSVQLETAFNALSHGKSVIGPSTDGGYYLIGLARPASALFKNIQWGGASVLRDTLSRASELGIELTHLEPIKDIDEWPDLVAAAKTLPRLSALISSFKE